MAMGRAAGCVVTVTPFEDATPELGAGVFIAPSATVLGRVTLGDDSSVWFGCVLRGDVGAIRVGARTNIQDISLVHVTGGQHDTHVGSDVTVGHRVVLHGCHIADHVLVGMGAIVLDGAVVEPWSVVAAGTLVPPGFRVPEGSLVMGSPAKVRRPVSSDERVWIARSAQHYVTLAARHAAPHGHLRTNGLP